MPITKAPAQNKAARKTVVLISAGCRRGLNEKHLESHSDRDGVFAFYRRTDGWATDALVGSVIA